MLSRVHTLHFVLNAFDAHVLHLLDPGVGVSEQSQVFLCVLLNVKYIDPLACCQNAVTLSITLCVHHSSPTRQCHFFKLSEIVVQVLIWSEVSLSSSM